MQFVLGGGAPNQVGIVDHGIDIGEQLPYVNLVLGAS